MAKFTDKISNLINSQAPEFVVTDHPKFLEFVKSYFTFMESAEISVTSVQTSDGIRLESELNTDTSTLLLDASRLDTDRTQLDAGDKVILESSTYGKFTRGETVTGQTSKATAVILKEDLANGKLYISAQNKFIEGESLVGASSNATAIISNVVGVTNFNSVATQSEHPNFTGTTTNVIVDSNTLKLDSSELFDSASGDFDTETTRFFDSGVANADFYASGNYLFADVIDIGAKHTARITASLSQSSDNPDDLFDNRSGNFDSSSSNFDGDTPANANAHLEIATSDDNVTYTAFQTFVIGDYTARYFKFRVVLISRDLASTPVVSAVTVTIDMIDRIFSGNDIVSGAGTKSVTFTNPYKSVNYALGITAENMATGDFFTVSNKTINGFDVLFKNSGGTNVSRTFDFIAKGF